jgi:hypothetical protein
MSIVGKAEKQPAETDVYAISYSDDMTASDAPESAFSFILVSRLSGALVEVDTDASVSTPGNRYLLSLGAVLTLSGMAIGDRVYVTNRDETTPSDVDSADLIDGAATLTLTALHGVVLIKTAGGWSKEATVRVIVDVADKRVRNWVSGGTSGVTYKIETTTTSAEGRVLQDEIIVKVKEQ